jgi:hypothetical protein
MRNIPSGARRWHSSNAEIRATNRLKSFTPLNWIRMQTVEGNVHLMCGSKEFE